MNRILGKIISFFHLLARTRTVRPVVEFLQEYKVMPKITCLVLASLFWFYVDNKRVSETHLRVPVQMELDHDYAVSEIEKTFITVDARGSSEELRNITQNNISAYVKIQNPSIGETARYPVRIVGHEIPDTVNLAPEDKTLFVKVERRITRKIPVVPDIKGSPGVEYFVGNIKADPEEIEISGAESIVRQVQGIMTEQVSLVGKRGSFQDRVRLKDGDLKECEFSQKVVDLVVPFYESRDVVRVNADVQIRSGIEDLHYVSSVKVIMILVKKDKPDQVVSDDDFEAWVDLGEQISPQLPVSAEEIVVGNFPVHVRSKTSRQYVAVMPDRITVSARRK